MTSNELNRYIQHYVEKDRTKSAIMLTGEWGIGKSFYIQQNLTAFLKEKQIDCVILSLYGLKTIEEVSKSIYCELRLKKLQINNEVIAAGKLIAKTCIKGLISHAGINLESFSQEVQELYNSIDLSGKLIILEDIERSQIDILDLLGYVNSLVEQDGVKVLLVANELEILRYDEIEYPQPKNEQDFLWPEEESRTSKRPTEKTLKYFAIKEKTISDTIQFEGNFESAVPQIIKSYHNRLLDKFTEKSFVKQICEIMEECNSCNLRSFMFACQKSADIFEQIKGDYKDDFIQCIFFGVLYFSLQLKAGKTVQWDGSENYSIDLGSEKFPLFKFCFEYIQFQKLEEGQIAAASKAYQKMRLYDKQKTLADPDLRVLFNYYMYFEQDIRNAMESISQRLKNPEDISFYDYGSIGVYSILMKHLLDIDISGITRCLVYNLKGQGNELALEELFRTRMAEGDEELIREYKKLRKDMDQALKENIEIFPGFAYLPEQADAMYWRALEQKDVFLHNGRFARLFNIKRLADMFSKCTPNQKDRIRGAFLAVYRINNIRDFFTADILAISELRKFIQSDMGKEKTDRIQKLQYEWFLEYLDDILQRLS